MCCSRGLGGGAYSFFPCLSHSTIDHAFLSRWSTVPNPWKRPPTFGHSLRFFQRFCTSYVFSLAVCGHHLFPRIAVDFSLLSNVPKFSMSHPSVFLISPSIAFLSSLHSSLSCAMWVLLSSALPQGKARAPSPSPTRPFVNLFFCQVQVPYTKTKFQSFRVVHWAEQIRSLFYFSS